MDSRRRRKWLQVSLRTFLLLCFVAGVGLSGIIRGYLLPDTSASTIPTDGEVISAVLASGQLLPPKPYQITKYKISEYVDPPRINNVTSLGSRFMSAVKRSQLLHAHYRCIVMPESPGTSVEAYIEKTRNYAPKTSSRGVKNAF